VGYEKWWERMEILGIDLVPELGREVGDCESDF
jgi:hypothetical protein